MSERRVVVTAAAAALLAAERLMPRADETSQRILAGSALMRMMMQDEGDQPCHETRPHVGATHHDVTGIFQRRKGRR
jgi:hypothetical protein